MNDNVQCFSRSLFIWLAAFVFAPAVSYSTISYASDVASELTGGECHTALYEYRQCPPYSYAFLKEGAFYEPPKTRLVDYNVCGPIFGAKDFADFINITTVVNFPVVVKQSCSENSPNLVLYDRDMIPENFRFENSSSVHSSPGCEISRNAVRGGTDVIFANYDIANELNARLCQFRAYSTFMGLPFLVDAWYPAFEPMTLENVRRAHGVLNAKLFFYVGITDRSLKPIEFKRFIDAMPSKLACQKLDHVKEDCHEPN